jgi:hypothetical protein
MNLQSDCLRDFGCLTPFGKIISELFDTVSAEAGYLQRGVEIFEKLLAAKIIPRVIVIVGSSIDAYGNRMLWFTDEQKDDLFVTPLDLEWMYVTSGREFELFQRFAMVVPDSDPSEREEPLIDPVLYSLEEIDEFIKLIRGERL